MGIEIALEFCADGDLDDEVWEIIMGGSDDDDDDDDDDDGDDDDDDNVNVAAQVPPHT